VPRFRRLNPSLHQSSVTPVKVVDAIKVDPAEQSKMVETSPGHGIVEVMSTAMGQAELLWAVADKRIKLGDLEAARILIRRIGVLIRTREGPLQWVYQAGLAAALVRAGDQAGALEILERVDDEIKKLTDPEARGQALIYLAKGLGQVGQVDRAIELARSLKTSKYGEGPALSEIAQGFTEVDPDDHGGCLDPGGVKILIGSNGVRPKDRDASRVGLAKVASAVGQVDDKLSRARILSYIAELQAMSGDLAGATATAEAIPEIKKADCFGPPGFFDAIKPGTLAIIARYHVDDKIEAKRLLDRAGDLARSITTEDQAIYARLLVAQEMVKVERSDAARDLLRGAEPIAVKQPSLADRAAWR
jgi:tetratricopeptide (TPR) repeat protein